MTVPDLARFEAELEKARANITALQNKPALTFPT